MIPHPNKYLELLAAEDCEALHQSAMRILEETGFAVDSDEALGALADCGAQVERNRARFPAAMVESRIAMAPRRWIFKARNPARDVEIGVDSLLVSPGYGSPSIADKEGGRHQATMRDFETFASLAGNSERIDITGGLLVEPLDVAPALRPLETTLSLIERSDKPFLGSAAGTEGARESLELARIVFGGLQDKAAVMGLININSPLRLDARMAGALLEYSKARQPILLTPGILMGVTAPVTAAGAAAQALAELLACVVLAQTISPGAPLMIGTGGFGSDLRTGGPGFGRPENALGTLMGAQIARRLGLPFRCSGAVTGSRLADIRSGYERMMTALSAWAGGAHICLQGAGTLDSINSMSYEQFVIDLEIWGYIARLADKPRVDSETMAADLIATLPDGYLESDHTVEHMRREIASPLLASAQSYDEWLSGGASSALDLAEANIGKILKARTVQPIEEGVRRELERYAALRRRELS
jgi:trimethylamine--corrinoid protein Co-methyltransferase